MSKQNLKYSLGILISLMVVSMTASATVYYVDSAAGKDTNSGTSSSAPWKTLAKVSSHSYSAGDQILLKSGSTWREQISVRSSGASGKPIVFGAYGSGSPPLINGADLVTSWSGYSGNIYRASIGWTPSHVWYNGTLLTKVSGISSMTSAQKWYYSSGSLYIWATGNANPSGHSVEADRRTRAIDISSHSYITINGVSMKNSTSSLVAAWNAGHITVQNSAMKNAWMAIYVTATSPNLVVDHCTFAVDPGYVGRDFVMVSSTAADGPIVSNNVVGDIHGLVAIYFNDVNNAQAYKNTITGSGSGIEIGGTSRSVSGGLIHDNAIFNSDHRLVDGESIKLRGNPGFSSSARVYYNYIKGGSYTYDGIGGWYSSNSLVYGNIITNCAQYGIQFTQQSHNNVFYNNTIYKNTIAGIALYTQGSALVRNNIIQMSGVGISADSGVSVSEDYNIINQVAHLRSVNISAGSHTTTSSPSFVSSSPQSSNDFKLKSGSAAIGSATNLGSPYNMILDPTGSVFPYPDLNQDSYGSWERGAFAFR
jgi:parallel beta-helix repeat protein